MKKLLACLLALLVTTTTVAGEVNLTWDASAEAAGYRIYHGVAPGVYNDPPLEVGAVTSSPLTTLVDGCVQQFVAMTAFNVLGESAFTTELTLFPRPVFLGQPQLVNNEVIEINGGNYAPGITLTINNLAAPFTIDSCIKISVPVITVPGLGQGQPVTVQLCNGPICASTVILPTTAPENFAAT